MDVSWLRPEESPGVDEDTGLITFGGEARILPASTPGQEVLAVALRDHAVANLGLASTDFDLSPEVDEQLSAGRVQIVERPGTGAFYTLGQTAPLFIDRRYEVIVGTRVPDEVPPEMDHAATVRRMAAKASYLWQLFAETWDLALGASPPGWPKAIDYAGADR